MTTKKQKNPNKTRLEKIYDLIRPGSRIFISSGPSMPIKTVTDILQSDHPNLEDLEIIQLVTLGDYFPESDRMHSKYRLKTFNAGESISQAVQEGKVDFIPAYIAEIPFLFVNNSVGIDVAVVQTAPPDSRGFLSLGIVMDVADLVIKNAPLVIAEINANVPVTNGETSIHLDQVDYVVESDLPLIEMEKEPYNEVTDKIGWHISNLIEDYSTVSLHVGNLFDAVASHLKTKKGLRIYTHAVSDWVMDLIESGAIARDRGVNHQGPVTTSSCFGSRKLYDYVDRNPFFDFLPLLHNTYQSAIPRIKKLVGIINAKRIDTTGDTVALNSGDYHLLGYDAKLNLSIGAAQSREGKVIVAVRSVDQKGDSNIVTAHKDTPDRTRSTLGTTQYVVTEYGAANIIGKSVRERTLAIIDIAHPDHREQLLKEAKAAGHLYPDQIYVKENVLNYPFSLETVKTIKNGLEVKFRPIKPSDEDMMRRLFYQFSDESKYMRYFSPIRTMTHKKMQPYVNIDYTSTLSLVGVIQRGRTEHIIAEARYSYSSHDRSYEIALVVDEKLQGNGIGSFMLDYLLKIAGDRRIQPLTINVLPENEKMLRVIGAVNAQPAIRQEDDMIQYVFNPGLDSLVV